MKSRISAWVAGGVALLIVILCHTLATTATHHPGVISGLFVPPVSPATMLRHYSSGDAADYSVTGDVTLASGETIPVRDGSMHMEIGAIVRSMSGRADVLGEDDAMRATLEVGGKVTPFSQHYQRTLSQDLVTRNTSLIGDHGGLHGGSRVVNVPQVVSPGVWGAGTAFKTRTVFSDGAVTKEAVDVLGAEKMPTVLGEMAVWVVNRATVESDGTSDTETDYFAPQIGFPVASRIEQRLKDGTRLVLSMKLTKTTVHLM